MNFLCLLVRVSVVVVCELVDRDQEISEVDRGRLTLNAEVEDDVARNSATFDGASLMAWV